MLWLTSCIQSDLIFQTGGWDWSMLHGDKIIHGIPLLIILQYSHSLKDLLGFEQGVVRSYRYSCHLFLSLRLDEDFLGFFWSFFPEKNYSACFIIGLIWWDTLFYFPIFRETFYRFSYIFVPVDYCTRKMILERRFIHSLLLFSDLLFHFIALSSLRKHLLISLFVVIVVMR